MGRNEQSFLMEIAGPKIEVPDLLKFETARNHALYANQSGLYDDILAHLNIKK